VQARITWLALRRSARWKHPRARLAARWAIFLFDALLFIVYVLDSSDLLVHLGIPPRVDVAIGAVGLGYLMAATGSYVLHGTFSAIRTQLGGDVDPGRRRVLNAAGGVLAASPLAVLGYGALVERLDFRVREIDVPFPQLPPDLDGLRIVQISDIHLSAFLSERQFAPVIDAANELCPHIALVTGDLISGPGDPIDACIRQVARLKADAGVFGCMGNHERYAGVEDYTAAAAARVGVPFLRRQARQLRFGNAVLNLAGVDYQSLFDKNEYLKGAERLLAPGAFNVLLSHNPDVFPVAARQRYDLMFSGHTHGGQVTVEILDQSLNPARLLTPYVYGLFRSGNSAAYVTRGIGTIGIPARIGAPPEIALLKLRKA
jgi:predicted MPP superfamily phosphohydrolase